MKPKDKTSTAYMRGWRDKGAGKARANPYDPGYMHDLYDKGYRDRGLTKAKGKGKGWL